MFDKIYEGYVRYWQIRLIYQFGFIIAWAAWATTSIRQNEATWLVFGWLPAAFWPVQAILTVGEYYGLDLPKLFGLG